MIFVLSALAIPTAAQLSPEEIEAQRAEYVDLVNPVISDANSIRRGKNNFMRYCMECHGDDGKAQVESKVEATDLTDPVMWDNGTTPGELFRSIREGTSKEMPPYKDQIRRETDAWHLVNYIVSLWPEEYQPDPPEAPEADGQESGE